MLTFHFSFLLAVSNSVDASYQVKGLTYEVKEAGCGKNSTSYGKQGCSQYYSVSGHTCCYTSGQISGTICVHGWFETSKGIAADLFPQKTEGFILPIPHWPNLLTYAAQLLATHVVDMGELLQTFQESS